MIATCIILYFSCSWFGTSSGYLVKLFDTIYLLFFYFSCFTNCKKKVNIKEKLSIQYQCKDCPTNIRYYTLNRMYVTHNTIFVTFDRISVTFSRMFITHNTMFVTFDRMLLLLLIECLLINCPCVFLY